MARPKATHWHLYVDESGNFINEKELVVVGAVAVSFADPFLNARLREALKRVAPLVPWPFHRWLATKPSIYALWRLGAPEVEMPVSFDAACERAVAIWKQDCLDALNKTQQKMKEGSEPESRQLTALRNTLKRCDPSTYEHLAAHADYVCGRIGPLFREVIEEGGEAKGERAEILSFLVGESDIGDAVKDGKGDRYFNMFVCLLERVLDALQARGGEHVVHVHVAERDCAHPLLKGVRTKFQRAHFELAFKMVMPSASIGNTFSAVRFSVGGAYSYNENTPQGIVVADSISNYLFGHAHDLADREFVEPLNYLHNGVRDYFGFLMTIKDGELSLASATGKARRLVDSARQFGDGKRVAHDYCLCESSVENVWTATQAKQWARFFEGAEVMP